jgi:TonB-dependent receptor
MQYRYTLLFLTLLSFIFTGSVIGKPVGERSARPIEETGKILGRVIDSRNGETMIGVSVRLDGTTIGTATDIEGRFVIPNVKPGSYKLILTYLNYQTRAFDVTVEPGREIVLNAAMEEAISEIKTVVVEAQRSRESLNYLHVEQKGRAAISDGVSAEQWTKTPDKTTGDVLKRVSGASIQDNKFVIIRGLNDRYNAAFINGAPLPSSEADRKAFSFDIFPTSLLSNMVISKTATPDMPGDFAGGIIQINTRDIPDKNFYTIAIGASGNSITTFREFHLYNGGKLDFLGIDDGTRALPKEIPASAEFRSLTKSQQLELSRSFDNDWATEKRSAIPGTNFQFSMGHKLKLFKHDFGSVFSLTHNRSFKTSRAVRKDFDKDGLIFEYNDDQYKINVLTGALWNLSYKISENNKLSFKNFLSINSDDQTILRTGYDMNQGSRSKATAMWYTQNVLISNQLSGDHYLPKSKVKMKWVLGNSSIKRDVPNYRRLRYTQPIENSDQSPYQAFVSFSASPNDGGRFYSTMKENISSAAYDVTVPVNLKNVKYFKTNDLKVGVYTQYRTRTFDARVLGYVMNGLYFDNSLLLQPQESIFDPQNMNNKGFRVDESTNNSDKYIASSALNAAYIMLDNKVSSRLRLVWGARFESFNQKLNSKGYAGDTVNLNTRLNDLLPSLNATYALNTKANLRFSASKTLSRPEFRELAPFSFFDFSQFMSISGNSKLVRTEIYNADVRYEIFPAAGQLFSITGFYKKFINPIEQVLDPQISGGVRSMSFQNVPEAFNVGAELEFRKKLGFLTKGIKSKVIFENMTFYSNFAYIVSRVDISRLSGTFAKSRALQGQSPYVVNTGLQYASPKGYSFSAALNRVGQRIYTVGTKDYRELYEKSRTMLDLQFGVTLVKKIDMKVNAGDLFAQNLIIYQNTDSKKGYSASDHEMYNFTMGRNYSVSFSYKF